MIHRLHHESEIMKHSGSIPAGLSRRLAQTVLGLASSHEGDRRSPLDASWKPDTGGGISAVSKWSAGILPAEMDADFSAPLMSRSYGRDGPRTNIACSLTASIRRDRLQIQSAR
jgi:hypothetical protein